MQIPLFTAKLLNSDKTVTGYFVANLALRKFYIITHIHEHQRPYPFDIHELTTTSYEEIDLTTLVKH